MFKEDIGNEYIVIQEGTSEGFSSCSSDRLFIFYHILKIYSWPTTKIKIYPPAKHPSPSSHVQSYSKPSAYKHSTPEQSTNLSAHPQSTDVSRSQDSDSQYISKADQHKTPK